MELMDAIANVGFPMGVTAYVLLRLEAKMDKLTAAIDSLTSLVKK